MSGFVADAHVGNGLPGAQVRLAGTSFEAVTDRLGFYRIAGVPAGEYTAEASYLGFDNGSATVSLAAGSAATANFRLKLTGFEEEVTVIAPLLEGQAKALSHQAFAVAAEAFRAEAGELSSRVGRFYARPDGRGLIVATDQLTSASRYILFPREGAPASPHAHAPTAVLEGGADATDGLDATSAPLPGFPRGLLVAMNSASRNFLYYRPDEVGF